MNAQYIRDQIAFAREGADNLARKHGYTWKQWLHGRRGVCQAGFERDGEFWSLSFTWTQKEELGILAKCIEEMDYCMRLAQKEFKALKLGAVTKELEGA